MMKGEQRKGPFRIRATRQHSPILLQMKDFFKTNRFSLQVELDKIMKTSSDTFVHRGLMYKSRVHIM